MDRPEMVAAMAEAAVAGGASGLRIEGIANLRAVRGLAVNLTDLEHGQLNPLGLNCIRTFPPAGNVVWGARTSVGDDRLASEWKYLPVRRLALNIEESLFRGTQWVVFEPNDEDTWALVRQTVSNFLLTVWRSGALRGQTQEEAFFVTCDRTTMTEADIDADA